MEAKERIKNSGNFHTLTSSKMVFELNCEDVIENRQIGHSQQLHDS